MMEASRARTSSYDPMTGVPIGAAVAGEDTADYGQADLGNFAMGALAQHRAYQPYRATSPAAPRCGSSSRSRPRRRPRRAARSTSTRRPTSGSANRRPAW